MKGKIIDVAFVLIVCALIVGVDRYINRDILKTEIIAYEVIETFDDSIPKDVREVIVEGQDGKVVTNLTTGESTVVTVMVPEEVVVGTGPKADYVGRLTGYGPDCPGCTGVLYCPDSEGKYHYLTTDEESMYFEDKEYGKVRILASDYTLFPCGTIMHVKNSNLDIYGVVMDTGIAMRNAWRKEGKVLLDLAFPSQAAALYTTNNNTNFTVLRWGW